MNGGGHDVAGGERVFHHMGVNGVRVAAANAVQVADALIRRQNQPARPAGVVGYAVVLQRLGASPVQIVRDGEMRG